MQMIDYAKGLQHRRVRAAPYAQDFTHPRGNCASAFSDADVAMNRTRSRVRAHVEHPVRILICVFSFRKVRYRGIARFCPGRPPSARPR